MMSASFTAPVSSRSVIRRLAASASGEEQRDQQRQRERVRHERREHVHEELEDEMEGDALGDDEVRQVIEPVDDEEKREQRATESERRDQLAQKIPIEHEEPHASVVP